MPDILISFNEDRYDRAIAHIENIGNTVIQNVVDEYATLGINNLVPEDLSRLFGDTENLIFDKMTGGQVVIQGMETERSKVIDLFKKPNGYDAFIVLVKSTVSDLKDKLIFPLNYPITPSNIDSYFELDGDLNIVFKDSMKEKIEESLKVYAKSNKAKALLAFAQDIIASYEENGIQLLNASNGDGVSGLLKEILNNPFGQGVSLNVDGIVKYNHSN
jgi:hypothetical protein